jgi:hypothetical protein
MSTGNAVSIPSQSTGCLNYIPDGEKDLFEDGQDLLGTRPYAEALLEAVRCCPTPFTIGLVGGWGTGKSSVVATLKRHLDANKDGIRVFLYDAWKYSQDSFRRTFLLQLMSDFHLDNIDGLDYLYKERHEETEVKSVFNAGAWVYFVLLGPVLLVVAKLLLKVPLTPGELITGVGLLVTIAISLLREWRVQLKASTTSPRTFAPEQFERIFTDIVAKITSTGCGLTKLLRGQNPRLVIVIDNIDRCQPELARELLLTTKGFLEKRNVVFVLPVDAQGLKGHLQLPVRDGDEFLRKLFNTTLRIRHFPPVELYDFAERLNERYALGLPSMVLSLAAQEFAKNPRRMIQFLNRVQTERALTQHQEELGVIPEGSTEKSVPLLAKLLIIQEEWPEMYEALTDEPRLLAEATATVNATRETGLDYRGVEDSEGLRRFLMRTQNIDDRALADLINVRNTLAGVPQEVNSMVLSQDWVGLSEFVQTGGITLAGLLRFIAYRLDEDCFKRRQAETTGYNILALILKIAASDTQGKALDRLYDTPDYDRLRAFIKQPKVSAFIFQLDPELLLPFARSLSNRGCASLADRIVGAINSIDPKSDSLLVKKEAATIMAFIQGFADVPSVLEGIQDMFTQLLLMENYYKSLKELLEKKQLPSVVIKREKIAGQVGALKENSSETDAAWKVDLLQRLNENGLLDQVLRLEYLAKVAKALKGKQIPETTFWLNACRNFVRSTSDSDVLSLVNDALVWSLKTLEYYHEHNGDMDTLSQSSLAFIPVAGELFEASDVHRGAALTWLTDMLLTFANVPEVPDCIVRTITDVAKAKSAAYVKTVFGGVLGVFRDARSRGVPPLTRMQFRTSFVAADSSLNWTRER